MSDISSAQVLSTLIDQKASNGNVALESSEIAKQLQKETLELGKVLIGIDEYCGLDEEYFDAPSEFYTPSKNTEEQFFDALDKPYKKAQEGYGQLYKSRASLELEKPKLGTVSEEGSESKFIEDAKSTL